MGLFFLFFIISSFFLIFVTLGILKTKGHKITVLQYDGKKNTYSLENIKDIIADYDSDTAESIKNAITKRNSSILYESLPPAKVFVDSDGSATVVGERSYGKKKNKAVLSEMTKQLKLDPGYKAKSMTYLKNQHGPNKQAKTLIDKKDAWNSDDYKTFDELMTEREKLLDNNLDDLTERLKTDGVDTLTYDDVAKNTKKYETLEKYADKFNLKELYGDAKTKEIHDKIEGLDDLYELSKSQNEELDRLEDLSKQFGFGDELVTKYIQEFKDHLIEDENKLNRLKSIFSGKTFLNDKNLSEIIKTALLKSETEYLKDEFRTINKFMKDLDISENVFYETDILTKRKELIDELELLKNNNDLTTELKTSAMAYDNRFIKDIVNFYWTSIALMPLTKTDSDKGDLFNSAPKINELLEFDKSIENAALYFVSDDIKRNAIIDVMRVFPSSDDLMGIDNISDLMYKQIDLEDGHTNDFAEMILDLVQYKSDKLKLEQGNRQIEPKLTTALANLICEHFGENIFNVSLSQNGDMADKELIDITQIPNITSGVYSPGKTTATELKSHSDLIDELNVKMRPYAKTKDAIIDETLSSKRANINPNTIIEFDNVSNNISSKTETESIDFKKMNKLLAKYEGSKFDNIPLNDKTIILDTLENLPKSDVGDEIKTEILDKLKKIKQNSKTN